LLTFFLFVVPLVSICLNNDSRAFAASDSFSANGQIGTTILGMPPSTDTVNMSTVQKFILSGSWELAANKGNITNFKSEFYTGPINGANNHTHLLTNLRVQNDKPVELSTEGSTKVSGHLDVKINGQSAWSNVPTTISISNGRTISISLADNGTQRHFMGQPIYGIVKELDTTNIPSSFTMLNSNMTNKSSDLNNTIPERLPPQSINGSNVPKI
jgi:hypothetical protein